MGLLCPCKVSTDAHEAPHEAPPWAPHVRTAPPGYELRRCENGPPDDGREQLLDVVSAPPDAPAAATLLAKAGVFEARGHRLLRHAHRRVADSILRSPHVVACVALNSDFVVMPRFETSLADACEAGQVDVGDILSICADMVRGVVFLATCGLVHGDLAPFNVALERLPIIPAAGQGQGRGRRMWRGVIIDLETLRRVSLATCGVAWRLYYRTRPLFYAVARHHRYDDGGSRVDVVDELEAVGWTLLWAMCTATDTRFPLADPKLPSDEEVYEAEVEAAAHAAGRVFALHPAETRLMHAKTALRARLAGQAPRQAPRQGGGGGGKDGEGKEGPPSSTPDADADAAAAAAAAAASSAPAEGAILQSPVFAPVRAYFAALARVPRRAPVYTGKPRERGWRRVWSDLVSLPPAEVDMLTRCLVQE